MVRELLASPVSALALLHLEPLPETLRDLVSAFREAEVPCHPLPGPQLAAVSDARTPQGVVAVAAIPSWGWADLGAADLLVLDSVRDPGNVGTLLRAAEGFGMGGAVSLPGTADPWSPKVTRAAAGSSLRLPIVQVAWSLARRLLGEGGWEVWAADAGGAVLDPSSGPRPCVALVLGNEGSGVSETVIRDANRIVSVPLDGPVDSLNVGVAGAVLMDRLRRRRGDG